jgi:hypothetical protein
MSQIIHTVKLTARTMRGTTKLIHARRPEHWMVLEQRESVGFSNRAGPWLRIRPMNTGNAEENIAWVSLIEDLDFNVEIIR